MSDNERHVPEAAPVTLPVPAEGLEDSDQEREEALPPLEIVIATLDSEISRFEQAVTRSGFTTWAVMVAFAGVFWLLLAEVSGVFQAELAIVIFLYLSAASEGVEFAMDKLKPSHETLVSRVGYLRTFDVYGASRTQDVIKCLRGIALIWLAWKFLPGPAPMLASLFGLSVINASLRIALSLNPERWFSQIGMRKTTLSIEVILVYAGGGIAILGIASRWSMVAPAEWRISLLGIAATYLIVQLGKPHVEIPALIRLREIRRDVGFGRLTTEEAVDEAELVLVGLSALGFILPEITQARNVAYELRDGFRAQLEKVILLEGYLNAERVSASDLHAFEGLCTHVNLAQSELAKMVSDLMALTRTCEKGANKYMELTKGDKNLDAGKRVILWLLTLCEEFEKLSKGLTARVAQLKNTTAVVEDDATGTIRARMAAACARLVAAPGIASPTPGGQNQGLVRELLLKLRRGTR